MRKTLLACAVFAVCAWARQTACGGMIPPPSACGTDEPASIEFGVGHDINSQTGYKVDLDSYGSCRFDMRRKATSAWVSYGDLFVAGSMIHDSEMDVETPQYDVVRLASALDYYYSPNEQDDISGDGFTVAAGIRNRVWKQENLSLLAYGQVMFTRESCGASSSCWIYPWYDTPVPAENVQPDIYPCPPVPPPDPTMITLKTDVELNTTELVVGLVARYSGRKYSLYGGAEFTPYSDIEMEVTINSTDGTHAEEKYDVERDQSVTFVLGWQASFKHGFLLLESRAAGEKGLRVGLGAWF